MHHKGKQKKSHPESITGVTRVLLVRIDDGLNSRGNRTFILHLLLNIQGESERDSIVAYLDVAVGRGERQRSNGGHLGGDLRAATS